MSTNATAAPTVAQLLQRVAGSGETVTIAYNGGSRPGQARPVVPISVSSSNLVASERGAKVNKTYKLALIAWAELSSGVRAINAQVSPLVAPKPPPRIVPDIPNLGALAAYVEHYRAELTAAGWHLYEEPSSFGVATRYKKGTPKKTPSIWLRYFEPNVGTSTETFTDTALVLSVGADGELESHVETIEQKPATRRPARPWRVDSWRLPTGKTFRDLQPAFALFIDEVRSSDPVTAKGAFSGRKPGRSA
jgi:hypothetical protein